MRELPYTYDLTILTNRTWRKRFRWLPAGGPADLTGWTARLQIRQAPEDDEVLLELSTDDDSITLDADGFIEVTATEEQTAELEDIIRPRYDLALRSEDSSISLLIGTVNVVPTITDLPTEP